MRTSSTLALSLCLLACGSSEEAPPAQGIRLDIEYPAATTLDSAVQENFGGCVSIVNPTHFHGDWDEFRRRLMDAEGDDLWRATSWVSAPGRYRMRIDDPNTCGEGGGEGADGSVFRNVIRINGTVLTEKVLTPSGEGPRTSFEFIVRADGTIENPSD